MRSSIYRNFFQFAKNDRPQRNLRNTSAFQTAIKSMAPGTELIFGLAQGWEIFGEDADPAVTPAVFTIAAEYGFFGKSVKESHTVDLRPYMHTEGERDPVVEELERLRKMFERQKDAQQGA